MERVKDKDAPFSISEVLSTFGISRFERKRGVRREKSGSELETELRKNWNFTSEQNKQARSRLLTAWVKDHVPQEWDPNDPVREVKSESGDVERREGLKELQELIEQYVNEIEEVTAEEKGQVCIYPTLGTPLDHLYGTDAFVEYKGVQVFLDVTKNTGGQDPDEKGKTGQVRENKAQIYITPEHVDPTDPMRHHNLNRTARQITELIRRGLQKTAQKHTR